MLLSQGCGDLIKEILFENVKVQFVVLCLKCLTKKQRTLHSTFLFSLVNDAVSVELQLLKFQTCRCKLVHMAWETAPVHIRYYWSAACAGGIWSGWYVRLCTLCLTKETVFLSLGCKLFQLVFMNQTLPQNFLSTKNSSKSRILKALCIPWHDKDWWWWSPESYKLCLSWLLTEFVLAQNTL